MTEFNESQIDKREKHFSMRVTFDTFDRIKRAATARRETMTAYMHRLIEDAD